MTVTRTTLSNYATGFRVVFGLVWLIDAIFKWQPGFINHFSDYIMDAAAGQPHWLDWWFNFWMQPFMQQPVFFGIVVAIIESLVAIFLILGLARKYTYIVGAVFAFLIWGLGEGFGGPYANGATDIGSAVMYIFIFFALFLLDKALPSRWSLDTYFGKKFSWWSSVDKPQSIE